MPARATARSAEWSLEGLPADVKGAAARTSVASLGGEVLHIALTHLAVAGAGIAGATRAGVAVLGRNHAGIGLSHQGDDGKGEEQGRASAAMPS